MTIALTGGSNRRPTPKYRIQWNGLPLPHGYVQSVSEPVTKRVSASGVEGRDGGSLRNRGTEFRQVSIVLRILSRLDSNNSGLSHLDDVLDQVREDLRVVDTDTGGELMIGDSDRYLDAVLDGYDHPATIDAHNGMNLTLNFRAQPYYRGVTVTTNTRLGASVTRISGTANGAIGYIAGRYNQALLCNAAGEYVAYPPTNNIEMDAGTMVMWLRPQYGSTEATDRVAVRIADASNNIDVGWDAGSARFRAHGASDTPVYAQAPALTFASGANIFLALRWNNLGTVIFVGSQSGPLLSGSSATLLNANVVTPTILRVGGNGTQFNLAGQSNIVIFGTALTNAQVSHLHTRTTPYDPMDTALPTSMLLDLPLNATTWANSSSNAVYLDTPDTRVTYPEIVLAGTGAITVSHSNKVLSYTAAPNPAITIDTGTFAVIDANGVNRVANVADPNFGFTVSGSTREAFLTTAVTGSVDVTVNVTPRYER